MESELNQIELTVESDQWNTIWLIKKTLYEGEKRKMVDNKKVEKIRKKLDKLEKEANELKRLKSDYQYAKKFRRMIAKDHID